MKLTELRLALRKYVEGAIGSGDRIIIRGQYAISYSRGMDYVGLYHIVRDDKEELGCYVEERFFQETHEYEETLGKKFLDLSEPTQFKKVRKYFEEYVY